MASKYESPRVEVGPKAPEGLNPDIWEAVNYLRHWKNDFIQSKDFEYLLPTLDVLTDCMNEDLTTNLKGSYPLDAIAVHTMRSASENPLAFNNLLTNFAIKEVNKALGRKELSTYWLYSLTADKEHPSSLLKRGGVYRIGVRPDRESKSQGGAEIQQALAAKLLQGAENARVMGNTKVHHKFEMSNYKDRSEVCEASARYLEKARKGKLSWQKKHLAHIKEAVPATHTHDELIVLSGDRLGRRDVISPEDAYVRVFRAGRDENTAYYADIKIENVLKIDPNKLGQVLSSRAVNTASLKVNWEWNKFTDYKDIENDQAAPSYSISSGIDEKKRSLIQNAARSGKSIMHCNYDYDMLHLEFGHLYKDGAAAKQDARAIAFATQYGRGKKLAPSRLPKSEIMPSYEDVDLPSHTELQKLLYDLVDARRNNVPVAKMRENQTLIKMINSLGLQDLRLHFDEIGLKDTTKMASQVKKLNEKFYQAKMKKLDQFVAKHKSPMTPLGEKGRSILNGLVATKFQPQHIAEFAAESTIGPIAVNDPPLRKASRLVHTSIPEATSDTPMFSKEWVERWWTEISLGKLGASDLNVLQMGSAGWRKIKFLGTEALGKLFSRFLTYKMFVQTQFSDLGDYKSMVGNTEVELDYFETARPSVKLENFLNSALASLTHQEEDGYIIRSTSRETLLPTMANILPIDDTEYFQSTLNETLNDMNPALRSTVKSLYARWQQINEEVYQLDNTLSFSTFRKPISNEQQLIGNIILTKLMLEYETELRSGDKNHPIFQALQILLTAGIRNIHELRLEKSLNFRT